MKNPFQNIKFLFNRRELNIYKKLLGFSPHNLEYYRLAFSHSSLVVNTKKTPDNERLEFLGDAILSAIVASELYIRYNNKTEGELTKLRSLIVRRDTLNAVAEKLELEKYLHHTITASHRHNNIYGNAFEALVGAIFLDKGYETTRKCICNKILFPYLNLEELTKQNLNYKEILLQWSQKSKKAIVYEMIDFKYDNANTPLFKSKVIIEGEEKGVGSGFTKKESEQQAAREAIIHLKEEGRIQKSLSKNIE